MVKVAVSALIGFAIGTVATLWTTSDAWLVESIRFNLTWTGAREWLAALSGWAAFIAAAVSLPVLVNQWKEARKQTRFMIGDDEPTLDVVEHLTDQNKLVVRIVNWNRRAIFINEVITSTKEHPSDMSQNTAIETAKNELGEISSHLPIQVNGWEDRNNRPSFAHIDLLLLQEVEGSEPGAVTDEPIPFPKDATITAKIRMLGNVHRVFDITARAFPDD